MDITFDFPPTQPSLVRHEFFCKSVIPRRDHIPFPYTSTTLVELCLTPPLFLFLLTPLR